MALSPNTKLSYSSLNDLPLVQLPFDLIDSTLSSMQDRVNLSEASLLKSPAYIRESPTDTDLANQINQYQEGVRQQLRDIAATGDTNRYMSALNQAQNRLLEIYRPGGAGDILAQRLNQYNTGKQQITKDFEGDQRAINYFQNKLINDIGYSNDGTFNKIGLPSYVKNVSAKEIDEFANRNLDNIKDSLIGQGVSKEKIEGATTLYDFFRIEGVTEQQITNALLRVFPKEYIDSIYQQETVRGNKIDPKILIEKEIETKDDRGNPIKKTINVLNVDNPVGRLIDGYAKIGAREKEIHDRKFHTNQMSLIKYRNDLENPYIPPTSGYTEAITNPFLLDTKPIEIKDGKLKPVGKYDTKYPDPKTSGYIGAEKYGQDKPSFVPRNELSEQEVSIVDQIKSRYTDLYDEPLTDEQAVRIYNQALEDRKSTSVIFNRENDPKKLKNINDRVLGTEKKIVNVGVRPIYFLTSDGQISKPTNAQGAIEKLGVENLDKGIEGQISADNPLGLPTGDYATAITKDGKFVTMIIGNRSIEEDSHFNTLNQLSKPKYSLEKEVVRVRDDYGRLTGETYVSEPIIDITKDEKGNIQYRGVDAKITRYDQFGKPIGEPMPLNKAKEFFNQTNPYNK